MNQMIWAPWGRGVGCP